MTSEVVPSELDELYRKTMLDIGIPPRPAILDQLGQELRSAEPDFRRISDCVSRDVGLAAGLVKIANSPYFGFRLRARTVLQALNLLGLDVASKALAGIALRNEFSGRPSLERFWDASEKIAEYSGMLVGLLGQQQGVHADDAYTFGLFRDCGVPVLMRKFPQYREILGLANAEPLRRFTEIEEEHLPTNHALVGCMLAQSWSLPEEICQAIRHHHDFILLSHPGGNLPAASARLVALSQLAEHFHQCKSGRSQGHEWANLAPACLAILQLQHEQLDELQQALSHSLQSHA